MVRKNDEKQSGFLDSPEKILPQQNNDSSVTPARLASQPSQSLAQLGKTNAVQNPSKPELGPNKLAQSEVRSTEDILIERELAVIFRKYDTKKIIKALSRILAKP